MFMLVYAYKFELVTFSLFHAQGELRRVTMHGQKEDTNNEVIYVILP